MEPVPQTDTGRQEEDSKANGRRVVKELGKLTPIHAAGIEINRKVLADLAMNNPAAFKAIVDKVKK